MVDITTYSPRLLRNVAHFPEHTLQPVIVTKMEDLVCHFGDRSLWERYDVPKAPIAEVTEIWVENNDRFSPSLVETTNVSSADIESWLEQSPHRHFPSGVHTRSIRLLWVGRDPETGRPSPSAKVLERLADAWALREALDYARSCFTGVSALASRGETRVFTATYHPKLAMAWSCTDPGSEGPAQTHAIIFAEGEERTVLRRILGSKWTRASASHAMFPALLCSLMLAQELDSTLEEIKTAVRGVEERTGHHRFTTRRQAQPAGGELGQLSAGMSGCAAKLANGARKIKVVEALVGFIEEHARRQTDPEDHIPADSPNGAFSKSNIDLLRHRAQMQSVETAYVQQRVQIQIAALFHLIAQQDNAIAFDTASATRSIAASSLQDSSSMKMLALVAMFFLPGSFVAALFSTPLFAWEDSIGSNDISLGTRPQFALFWAVTAPLTALVFVLYAAWMCVQKRRGERVRRHTADV